MTAALRFERRPACPACGGLDAATLWACSFDAAPIRDYVHRWYGHALDPDSLAGASYQLDRCAACGLVFQREVLDAAGLAWLYGDVVEAGGDAKPTKSFAIRRNYSYQVEQLVKALGGAPERLDVLDYGAGWGLWLDMAAVYGCRTYCAELSPDKASAAAARHRATPAASLPPESFDFVNLEQVVEHLAEPLTVLRAVRASLRPGGIVRVSVPNGSNVSGLLRDPDWTAPKGSPRSLNAVAPLEHINCFDHGSLRLLGEAAGLQSYRFPARQAFDGWERARVMAAAVARPVRRPKGTLQYFTLPR